MEVGSVVSESSELLSVGVVELSDRSATFVTELDAAKTVGRSSRFRGPVCPNVQTAQPNTNTVSQAMQVQLRMLTRLRAAEFFPER